MGVGWMLLFFSPNIVEIGKGEPTHTRSSWKNIYIFVHFFLTHNPTKLKNMKSPFFKLSFLIYFFRKIAKLLFHLLHVKPYCKKIVRLYYFLYFFEKKIIFVYGSDKKLPLNSEIMSRSHLQITQCRNVRRLYLWHRPTISIFCWRKGLRPPSF